MNYQQALDWMVHYPGYEMLGNAGLLYKFANGTYQRKEDKLWRMVRAIPEGDYTVYAPGLSTRECSVTVMLRALADGCMVEHTTARYQIRDGRVMKRPQGKRWQLCNELHVDGGIWRIVRPRETKPATRNLPPTMLMGATDCWVWEITVIDGVRTIAGNHKFCGWTNRLMDITTDPSLWCWLHIDPDGKQHTCANDACQFTRRDSKSRWMIGVEGEEAVTSLAVAVLMRRDMK